MQNNNQMLELTKVWTNKKENVKEDDIKFILTVHKNIKQHLKNHPIEDKFKSFVINNN